MTLLRSQFPGIGGLYNTCLGPNITFPMVIPSKKVWMQIIRDSLDHWVLVAGGFEKDTVHIFDSKRALASGSLKRKKHVLACISALLNTEESKFKYVYKLCQQQDNGYDCGVYAIAFATTLGFGGDPSSKVYQKGIREHLQDCLRNQLLSEFPSTSKKGLRKNKEPVLSEEVWCHCRKIHYEEMGEQWEMIECSKYKN